MSHDGERPSLGVLAEFAGHSLELRLGGGGQVGGVGGEGDVAGQGDGDVLAPRVGVAGVIQSPGVALDGDWGLQCLFGLGLVSGVADGGDTVEGLVHCCKVDAGGARGVLVHDVDGDEAGLGDEDGDLLGIHSPEENEAAGGLARLECQLVVVVLDLVLHTGGGHPHPVVGQVQQAHPGRTPIKGPDVNGASQWARCLEGVVSGIMRGVCDVLDCGVVLGTSQLQGQHGGLRIAAHQR